MYGVRKIAGGGETVVGQFAGHVPIMRSMSQMCWFFFFCFVAGNLLNNGR